jgi:alpha-tubulin suppressor-like RCC1 family protein
VVGENATCVITAARELWCWGNGFDGAAPGLAPHKVDIPGVVRSVARLAAHGALWCWGNNELGQLGVGNRKSSAVPLRIRLPEDS